MRSSGGDIFGRGAYDTRVCVAVGSKQASAWFSKLALEIAPRLASDIPCATIFDLGQARQR